MLAWICLDCCKDCTVLYCALHHSVSNGRAVNLSVVQDLKTGMSENSVFSVFHPDASELFTVCSSLEKVHYMQ